MNRPSAVPFKDKVLAIFALLVIFGMSLFVGWKVVDYFYYDDEPTEVAAPVNVEADSTKNRKPDNDPKTAPVDTRKRNNSIN